MKDNFVVVFGFALICFGNVSAHKQLRIPSPAFFSSPAPLVAMATEEMGAPHATLCWKRR